MEPEGTSSEVTDGWERWLPLGWGGWNSDHLTRRQASSTPCSSVLGCSPDRSRLSSERRAWERAWGSLLRETL